MVPLVVMIFVMGLYPKPFIDKMDPAIKKLVAQARIAPVTAQMIPAMNQMQMPVGHQGTGQMPEANQGEMPAGQPGQTPPAVNSHDAK